MRATPMTTIRRAALLGILATSLSSGVDARTPGELQAVGAPHPGQVWEVGVSREAPLPAGAVLFGARGGDVYVLALAGPEGRFRVQLPAAPELEGVELSVWAEAPVHGARWRTRAQQVTVQAAGTLGEGYFDPSVDRFAITGCSLGCSSTGPNITCGIVNTFVNADIAVTFSQPVDLSWVVANPTSFRVIDTLTGATPPGQFLLDPADSNTLIWRPQLSFDPTGTPLFGLLDGGVYQIQIDGTLSGGPGPFVQSVTGAPLANRLLCTIVADQGVLDYVPGPPVLVLDPPGGATEVPLDSGITFLFEDIMNLGTVISPALGLPPFITITENKINATPIAGSYTFGVSTTALTTTLVFTPSQPLPAGTEIRVTVPPQVTDLVGNPVANAGAFVFTTTGD